MGDSTKALQLGGEEGFVPQERGFAVRLCILSCDYDDFMAKKRGIHQVKAPLRPLGWAGLAGVMLSLEAGGTLSSPQSCSEL